MPLEPLITNEVSIISPLEANGAVPVNVQDQTTPALDLYFVQVIGAPTALTAQPVIGDTTIDVVSVASISVGNYIGMFSGVSGENRFYFGEVLAINTLELTLDTPIDFSFDIGDVVISTTRDLNTTIGSLASPQIYTVQGPGIGSIDITRIMFSMTLSSLGDDGKFGNIAGGLTNGLVVRRSDGSTRNIFNVKDNGELATLAYDLQYTVRSGGGGDYGLRCRYTFAGQEKHGVAIRLSADEQLEVLIQDDLTSLGRFRMLAAGHIVQDIIT